MSKLPRSYSTATARLDRDVLYELQHISRDTGLSISRLIGDAVHSAMNARLERMQTIGSIQPQPAA